MRSRRLANAATSLFPVIVGAIACACLYACGGSSAVPQPSPTPTATTLLEPMGVDFGLKRQCIRGLHPDEANFYVDNHDCPGSPYPTSHYWLTLTGVSNPATFGTGCIPPTDQGF